MIADDVHRTKYGFSAKTIDVKAKWTQQEALVSSENRINNIAKDIITHFEQRQEVFEDKVIDHGFEYEVSFFQAVKAPLAKFDGAGRTNEEIETNIRQVIDQALVSKKVIDVFDAAGI